MKNNKAKSFITIMVSIALCALFLRVAIEQIIKININQNESIALVTLKSISAALEEYAKDNHGSYPRDIAVLTQSEPRYLDKDYISLSPIQGYSYECLRLEESGYSCYALPVWCGLGGKMSYSVTTAGVITSEECNKKE